MGDGGLHGDDHDQSCEDISQGYFLLSTETELPVSYEVAFAGTSVPESVAEGIWISLVSDTHAISPAPGCGPRDKMVMSNGSSFSYQ